MNAAKTAIPPMRGVGVAVDLARARVVHHPVAAREPPRRRHEGGGQGEGDDEHERWG